MEKSLKILKGFLIALTVFFITSGIFAMLLKLTSLPEKYSLFYTLICISLATLIFGIFIGALTMKGGMLYGGISAIIFTFMIYYASITLLNMPLKLGAEDLRFLIPVAFGCFGGMIGVNIKN